VLVPARELQASPHVLQSVDTALVAHTHEEEGVSRARLTRLLRHDGGGCGAGA
jgi:hypothetical protein